MSTPHKVKLAFCTNCECVTEMELSENPTEGLCTNCDTVQKYTQNPLILVQMKNLSVANEGLYSQILVNNERIERLGRMLNPVDVVKTPRWRKSAEVHECHKCGRKTRFLLGELPRCYQECKPVVTRGKIGFDEMPDAIQQMLRDVLDLNDDEDLGDVEFIRRV